MSGDRRSWDLRNWWVDYPPADVVLGGVMAGTWAIAAVYSPTLDVLGRLPEETKESMLFGGRILVGAIAVAMFSATFQLTRGEAGRRLHYLWKVVGHRSMWVVGGTIVVALLSGVTMLIVPMVTATVGGGRWVALGAFVAGISAALRFIYLVVWVFHLENLDKAQRAERSRREQRSMPPPRTKNHAT